MIERLLTLFVVEVHSLRLLLLVRIHLDVLAGRVLLLLHVLEAVIVELDVELPIRVLFIDFLDSLVADFFVSSDHYESITKSIKCSSCISLNYPKRLKLDLPNISDFGVLTEDISYEWFCG